MVWRYTEQLKMAGGELVEQLLALGKRLVERRLRSVLVVEPEWPDGLAVRRLQFVEQVLAQIGADKIANGLLGAADRAEVRDVLTIIRRLDGAPIEWLNDHVSDDNWRAGNLRRVRSDGWTF